MQEYPKIQSLYQRDPKTHAFVDTFSEPEFSALYDCMWIFREKVHGTNIRAFWDPEADTVVYGGRTDNAQLPASLISYLEQQINTHTLRAIFPDKRAVLYGEGFGGRIQKEGPLYSPNEKFALFDVQIDSLWLQEESITGIAEKLNVPRAPLVGIGNLKHAEEWVKQGFQSHLAEKDLRAEGLVLLPLGGLLNRQGKRIITKLKTRDYEK